MVKKYLEVGMDNWGVLVCYDYDQMDFDDIWTICRSFNLSEKKIDEALHVLKEPNTGMAISNADIRMSVIFVSNATSEDEWWSTLSHELWHVATSIIDYYDEPYYDEPAAYLYGELIRLSINEIGEPCR